MLELCIAVLFVYKNVSYEIQQNVLLTRSGDMDYGINNTEVITSRQNASVVAACKLSDKKYRDTEKKFRVDGIKLFGEILQSGVEIDTVFLKESSVERLNERIGEAISGLQRSKIKTVSDGVFEKMTEEKSPEGIICVAKHIDKLHKIVKINSSDSIVNELMGVKVFAVESVRDPGNMGTVIRTAAAFGVDTLLISSDCADLYNPRTVRAAMGALFRQRIIRVDDLSMAIKALSESGRKTYAATLGQSAVLLGEENLDVLDCIVVGNEGHGLSEKTINACDKKILIPMTVGAESLNAAVAASVCMWEQFGKNI